MTTDVKLVKVARSMLDGKTDLLIGVRQINRLRAGVRDPDAEIFDTIRGVESETDDLPIGAERSLWSVDALAEKDAIRDRYIEEVRDAILMTCQKIIEEFTQRDIAVPPTVDHE